MELLSVCVALESVKKSNANIILHSDSKYVVDAINLKWIDKWQRENFKKKANVDLWQRFLKIYRKHNVKFVWVKGHSNNVENNRCDELAVAAYKNGNLQIDEGYEASKEKFL